MEATILPLIQSYFFLLEEEWEDAKDPGEAEDGEDPDVDDEVGLAAVLVLDRLDHSGHVVDAEQTSLYHFKHKIRCEDGSSWGSRLW